MVQCVKFGWFVIFIQYWSKLKHAAHKKSHLLFWHCFSVFFALKVRGANPTFRSRVSVELALIAVFFSAAAVQVRRRPSLRPSWATATAPSCWRRRPPSAPPEAGAPRPATTPSGTPATRPTPRWDASSVSPRLVCTADPQRRRLCLFVLIFFFF